MRFTGLPISLLALVAICAPSAAFPYPSSSQEDFPDDKWSLETIDALHPPSQPLPLPPPRPLVVWHGLGDQYMSSGMVEFIELIKDMHPGIFVYSARISDEPSSDQRAGWFGDVNAQIEQVATQISEIEELQGGFDAIGFSQAGQFLRGYVERYNDPPVRNLITFGAQHMGISGLPGCKPTDFLCRAASSAARSGVYTSWAQRNLVQAQYFRDHMKYDTYLNTSRFLADINNEVWSDDSDDSDDPSTRRNPTYAENFASLDNFVMVLFDQDQTVIPKESSWFGSYSIPTDDDEPGAEPKIIHMKKHPLYKEDWIGLKTLDEAGKVFPVVCVGTHMQLSDECWRPIVKRWVGNIDMDIRVKEETRLAGPEIPPLLLQDW